MGPVSTFRYGAHVRANGIRQHYLRFCAADVPASRRPLVVVPGITSPAATWAFVGERLGRVFDTHVLDVRGRGLSEQSETLDYSLDAQAQDLVGFIAQLGAGPCNVLGHSMGARIALRATRLPGHGLAGVVLADPPVSGPGRRPYPANLAWYTDSIALACRGITLDEMRTFCPTWTEEQLRTRAEWLHTCDPRAIVASFNGFHEDDIHADLAQLRIPALLMRASRGGVITDEDAAEMRGLCPQLLEATVPDAGHMIPWDNEPGFYAALGDVLGAKVA
jgi:N-formylmaleamate deformylase